jgi:hypothetical protein
LRYPRYMVTLGFGKGWASISSVLWKGDITMPMFGMTIHL